MKGLRKNSTVLFTALVLSTFRTAQIAKIRATNTGRHLSKSLIAPPRVVLAGVVAVGNYN